MCARLCVRATYEDSQYNVLRKPFANTARADACDGQVRLSGAPALELLSGTRGLGRSGARAGADDEHHRASRLGALLPERPASVLTRTSRSLCAVRTGYAYPPAA